MQPGLTIISKHLLSAVVLFAGFALSMPAAPGQGIDAARTLSRPSSSDTAPNEDGFIQRWIILEPIPARGLTDSAVRGHVEKTYFPGRLSVLPKDGETVSFDGTELTWHAVETRLYNINLYHFAYALGKPTSNVLFWGITTINCREEIRDVRLAIGSNAASVWWVNGKEVIGIYNDRQTVIDDGVSKRITLKKGLNVVRCAVINAGGATDFCARFLDANDKPLQGYTISIVRSGE